jgi:hypothetical protein
MKTKMLRKKSKKNFNLEPFFINFTSIDLPFMVPVP